MPDAQLLRSVPNLGDTGDLQRYVGTGNKQSKPHSLTSVHQKRLYAKKKSAQIAPRCPATSRPAQYVFTLPPAPL
jgi:hypothetical protein